MAGQEAARPESWTAVVVCKLLPTAADYHAVPDAGHFSFLAPCPPWLPLPICKDLNGFERVAFHRDFNRAVVAFFQAKLAPR
jgi:predicted dienelactone hydrolase